MLCYKCGIQSLTHKGLCELCTRQIDIVNFKEQVTSRIRWMEKNPSSKALGDLRRQAKALDVSLAPWKRRLKNLENMTIVHEIHES